MHGRGLLIVGCAGAGKSALALDLIALGARLIADDAVDARVADGRLILSGPAPRGLIEARGIGLLRLPYLETHEADALLDLDAEETARLPERRRRAVLGVELPLLLRPRPLRPAAIAAWLAAGGAEDPETAVSDSEALSRIGA